MSQLIDAIDRLSGKLSKATLNLFVRVRGSRILWTVAPDRLRRNDRAIDSNFKRFERIYFRVMPDDFLEDRINPVRIRCFNMSVNWSKYSCPLDVICPQPSSGIARLLICRLPAIFPKELSDEKEKKHEFFLEHDPLDDNYSHCQVACMKGDQRAMKDSVLSRTAKKEYRTLISDHSVIILDAEHQL